MINLDRIFTIESDNYHTGVWNYLSLTRGSNYLPLTGGSNYLPLTRESNYLPLARGWN